MLKYLVYETPQGAFPILFDEECSFIKMNKYIRLTKLSTSQPISGGSFDAKFGTMHSTAAELSLGVGANDFELMRQPFCSFVVVGTLLYLAHPDRTEKYLNALLSYFSSDEVTALAAWYA